MPNGGGRTLAFADVSLGRKSLEVQRGDRTIELRRMEFLLLELFLSNPRRVLARSRIYERAWSYDFGPSSNSLDVHIGQLRRKLEEGERRDRARAKTLKLGAIWLDFNLTLTCSLAIH
jgi:two-component system response regulator MprA